MHQQILQYTVTVYGPGVKVKLNGTFFPTGILQGAPQQFSTCTLSIAKGSWEPENKIRQQMATLTMTTDSLQFFQGVLQTAGYETGERRPNASATTAAIRNQANCISSSCLSSLTLAAFRSAFVGDRDSRAGC